MNQNILIILLIVGLSFTTSWVFAETSEITTDASYTMGDGESPSFAESMVLQKTKQTALEQAGTYVQSYAKVKNYDLTEEEIQTIAGGVLKVEVLEKTRSLVADGLKFYVKIKATVTTDSMQELAQRIKGKNVAEEYKKLQVEYARLSRETESWKQLLSKGVSGPERETALDQIREHEKSFSRVQKTEAAFIERLVSGEVLFAKALGQLSQKQKEREIVDALLNKILEEGFTISFGDPKIDAEIRNQNSVRITIPVTVKFTDSIRITIENTARSLGGAGHGKDDFGRKGLFFTMRDSETREYFIHRYYNFKVIIEVHFAKGAPTSCYTHVPTSVLTRSGDEDLVASDKPREFALTMDMALDQARQIKNLKGQIVESSAVVNECSRLL